MESRVAFRDKDGRLLNSKSFASARGVDGYYVASAQWSPDSRFFVFSLSSSGGHSPGPSRFGSIAAKRTPSPNSAG